MNTKNIIICIVIAVIAIFGISLVTSYFSYNNDEIALRQDAEAQRAKIEGVHDKMWKVIQQKAQVSNEYASRFDSIYSHIMSDRYSANDGSLMKFIHESNPNFSEDLYLDLSQSIEVLRTEFQKSQERMIDIIREHSTLCKTYPGKWFISDTKDIEYTVISSSKSKAVMETGLDNDTNVF